MRFMIMVKSCADFEAEDTPQAPPELMAEMADFHEALVRAGVLLDAAGLHPSRSGWRVLHGADGSRRVVDGPFAEAKELIAGYTLIEVRSREEAMEWARRFPNPAGRGRDAVVEVRQLIDLEEFPATAEVERFKAMEPLARPNA